METNWKESVRFFSRPELNKVEKREGVGESSPGCQACFISLETLTSEVTGQAQSGQMLPGRRDGGGEVDGGGRRWGGGRR